MKDINGVRFTLRERWEMVSQDLREEIAIHGLRQLVVEGLAYCFYYGVSVHWYRSPVGAFIRKGSGGYDVAISRCREYVSAIQDLRVEIRQLRENNNLLREALEIGFAERQDKLELLLVDAEVNIRMRESEPF